MADADVDLLSNLMAALSPFSPLARAQLMTETDAFNSIRERFNNKKEIGKLMEPFYGNASISNVLSL